jgi:prolyl-tRNA editing enzyme YbaK/EbsC (Cys-tRNA(Pro) deacylase)
MSVHWQNQRKAADKELIKFCEVFYFTCNKKQLTLVVIAGNYRVNWNLLRNFLGENRISFATPGEVIYETNYQLGTVRTFLIKQYIPVLLVQTCFDNDTISIGSSIAHTAIMMKSQDLLKVLPESKVVSFANQVNIE